MAISIVLGGVRVHRLFMARAFETPAPFFFFNSDAESLHLVVLGYVGNVSTIFR